ncbi:hypothetical protein ACOME3_002597 [Neoechinorhynchus agilis]
MQRRISDHSPIFKRSKRSWSRLNRFETNRKSRKYHRSRKSHDRDRNQMPVFERRGDHSTWHTRNASRRRKDDESKFYPPQWRANPNYNYRPPSYNRNYRRYRNYWRETRPYNRQELQARPWSPELYRRQQFRKRESRPEKTRRYNRRGRETRPQSPKLYRRQQVREREPRPQNDRNIRKRPQVTLEFLDKQLDDYMAKCAIERMAKRLASETTQSNHCESKNEKL